MIDCIAEAVTHKFLFCVELFQCRQNDTMRGLFISCLLDMANKVDSQALSVSQGSLMSLYNTRKNNDDSDNDDSDNDDSDNIGSDSVSVLLDEQEVDVPASRILQEEFSDVWAKKTSVPSTNDEIMDFAQTNSLSFLPPESIDKLIKIVKFTNQPPRDVIAKALDQSFVDFLKTHSHLQNEA